MPLTRVAIVRQALALVDEIGLDGLTVRRLAERLDVQNPALYRHFKSKQDLLDSMAGTLMRDALAPLGEPAAGDAWDTWLARLACAFRREFLAHRDGARIIASANLSQRDLLSGLDQALRLLLAAGFELVTAYYGVQALFDYTLGATFEEQADPQPASERYVALQGVDVATPLPMLMAALTEITRRSQAGDTMDAFEAGVQLILAGLHATRAAAASPPSC
jgi:TetR/AcrR family tetracycline transcriptional repressor